MPSENTARLAVLIDADNAQPSITEGLLAEVAKYGTAHVKRAYGDWTAPNLRGWKDQLLAQSIHPIQQFAYTTGKNSTDAAMVIDAMDLLYSGRFDGFCIVSSDSDFTRLAQRLRESGLTVYGFGEAKTPQPFVRACDKFIYVENLRFSDDDARDDEDGADGTESGGAGADGASVKPVRRSPMTAAELQADKALVKLLRGAVDAASDDDGWAQLAAVGSILLNQRPDFDSRSYGYGKLSDLITKTTLFEMDRRSPGDGKQPVVFVREKRRAPARAASTAKAGTGATSTAKAGTARAGAVKAGTARAGAAKAGTAKVGADRSNPAKTSPAKTDTARTSTARADGARADGARTGAARAGGAETGTGRSNAARTRAAKTDTAGSGAEQASPGRAGAARTSAAKRASAKVSQAVADAVSALR